VEFKLLGPVQVYTSDGTTDLLSGSRLIKPKHRLMLAALLIAEGNRVGMERLIDQMWGADRDELIGPHSTLHHYASNLRKVLRSADPDKKEDPLPSVANGYRINIEPRQVDVLRFRDLASQARARSGVDDEEAVRLWRLALAEWGPRRCGLYGPEALAGLRGQWASNYRITLQREHREAVIGLLDAELRIGEHQHVITELAALDAGDGGAPDEDLARIRMLAHRGAGRPGDGEDPLAGESESGSSAPERSAEGHDKPARLVQEFHQVHAPNSQFGIHY
jgi:DNA-binding SARP family transcriptional activator